MLEDILKQKLDSVDPDSPIENIISQLPGISTKEGKYDKARIALLSEKDDNIFSFRLWILGLTDTYSWKSQTTTDVLTS